MRYDAAASPLAIAHRGGAGLAVENTLNAFTRSSALGIRYLETDVRVTADGIPILFHDAGTQRLLGLPGRIEQRRRDQLPAWIPTLESALRAHPDRCFTIDVKVAAAIGPVADVVLRVGAAQRVCFAGAWDRTLDRLAESLGPQLSIALGWRALFGLLAAPPSRLRSSDCGRARFAHVPVRIGRLPIFRDALVDRAHEIGVRVIVWTVNDPATMLRLLDAQVDGIITDRPDILRDLLIGRDQWAAPGPALRARTIRRNGWSRGTARSGSAGSPD
jgi:glycerophosphoryl diester phosphodiesterase